MATSTTGARGADIGDRHDRGIAHRAPARLTTETKHSLKTTEFFGMVAVIVGILISAAAIKGGDTADGTDEFIARQAWLYVSIVAGSYFIGRGLAKSGSRDPYFEGGTNSDRDIDRR